MSEINTKVLDKLVGEEVKFSPGENLESLYSAYHEAEREVNAAKNAFEEAEGRRRRRLLPACLKLLAERETASHGHIMAIYERAQIVPSVATEHLALARVYRLFPDQVLAEWSTAGTLLSANQGAAISKAFELYEQLGLGADESRERVVALATACALLGIGPEEIRRRLEEYAERQEDARAAHGGRVVKIPAALLREMATRISAIVKPNGVKPQMLLVEALNSGEFRLSTTIASKKFEATATARARLQGCPTGEFKAQVAALELLRAVLANKEDVVRLGSKPGGEDEDAKLLVIFGQGQNRVVREFEDDPSGEVVVTQDRDTGDIIEVNGFGSLIRSVGRFANAKHSPAIKVGVDDEGGVVLATDSQTAVKARADIRGARGTKVLLPARETMVIAAAFHAGDPVRVTAEDGYAFIAQDLKECEGSVVFAVRESERIANIEKVISGWESDASFVCKAGELRKVFAGFGNGNKNRTEFFLDPCENRLGLQWDEPRQRLVTAIEVKDAQGEPRGFTLSRKAIELVLKTVDIDALRIGLPAQRDSLVKMEGAKISYYLAQFERGRLTAMPEPPTVGDLEGLELPEPSSDAIIIRAADVEDLCAQLRERLADTDGPITARIEVGQGGDDEDGPDDDPDGDGLELGAGNEDEDDHDKDLGMQEGK